MSGTVFLTGGAGRIGRRVLVKLLDRGYHVRVLVHNNEPEGITSSGMTLVRGDVRDRSSFAEAVAGCDFVCHLAAVFEMGTAVEDRLENDHLFDHLVRGTYNVLEAARQAGSVRLFTFASSDAVFCAIYREHEEVITEEVEITLRPGRFYSLAKATLEALCANYEKSYGLPCAIHRVGWTLDESDVLQAFEPEFWETLLAPGEQERLDALRAEGRGLIAPLYEDGTSVEVQLAHADDIADGFVLAVEHPRAAAGEIFNIAGAAPFRFLDCIERVARGLDRPWAGIRLSGLGRYRISNDKAGRLLGYAPQYTIDRMIDLALERRTGG